jgi:hypothetical protein
LQHFLRCLNTTAWQASLVPASCSMRWPHERFLLRLHSSRAKLTRDFERDLKTGSGREFARRHF